MPDQSQRRGDAQGPKQSSQPSGMPLGGTNQILTGGFEWAMAPTPAAETISWLSAAAPPPEVEARNRAYQAAGMGDFHARQGRFSEALPLYSEAVRLHPENAEYHLRLGITAWQTDRRELGERHLLEAIRLAPDNPRAHEALSQFYGEAGNMARALHHSARAIELAPDNAEIITTRAGILKLNGQPEAAWQLIAPLVAAGAGSDRLAIVYGRIAPKIKRERDALQFIQRLLQSASPSPQQRTTLHFTAATLLDRLGQWDAAFKEARKAHEVGRRPYDPAQHTQWIQRQIDYFTPYKLHDLPRASHRSRRPIFIVGMLRSGTSLVEQILASHPQVHGAGELSTLRRIAVSAAAAPWAAGATYPEYLDTLSVRSANELAQVYLSHLSSLNDTATYVTDKMPHNFLHLGLIATLFPDCHVIHCSRDPLDTCVSCYMTQFMATRHEFTHSLSHLGAFYRDYHRLMRHWKTTLNYPIIEVNYEALVNDLEGQTRRLLEYLDLPWDERCLQFHQNKRHVATASYDQVRRPIYRSSIGRWKHYEKHLAELMPFLVQSGLLSRTA